MKLSKFPFFVPYSIVLFSIVLLAGCSTSGKKKPSPEEHARLLIELANAALIEGDATGALQVLSQAEKESPNLPDLFHSKALALYAKRDLEGALTAARRSVQLKPDYPEAQNTLGKLYIEAGRPGDARAPLLEAAKNPLYRESYKAETNLGIIDYRQGNFTEALAHFSRATDQAPNEACIAHYYRGHLALRESRFKDAVRDYDRATRRLCGNFSEAHLALGIAYQRNGEFLKARKKFVEIQKINPDSPIAEQASRNLRKMPW